MSNSILEDATELQEPVPPASQGVHNFASADHSFVTEVGPSAFSTPKPHQAFLPYDEISDERLLESQTLKEGEQQSEEENLRSPLSVSRTDLSSRKTQSTTITGLPSTANANDHAQFGSRARTLASHLSPTANDGDSLASTSSLLQRNNGMGAAESRATVNNAARHIMSAEPQDLLQNRKKVAESEITGNCRPWSDHVYYKLFMDTEGRNARLMVLKCEISYVDLFTDEEHSLYKSRFIGGKSEGVAQMFAFDLMKATWEEKIPKSQAIELNVDIVMSSSPIHFCSETLLNLIQLEKTYLKHRNFDGQLNVMIRFAHGFGWDIKDDAIRERVHTGLRNLFREGVNLEVMSADVIMEEMRVDGIPATDDERLKHYISRRYAWSGPVVKAKSTQNQEEECTSVKQDSSFGEASGREATSALARKKAIAGLGDSLASMTDEYFVYLHSCLWNIIQDTKRVQDILSETLEDN